MSLWRSCGQPGWNKAPQGCVSLCERPLLLPCPAVLVRSGTQRPPRGMAPTAAIQTWRERDQLGEGQLLRIPCVRFMQSLVQGAAIEQLQPCTSLDKNHQNGQGPGWRFARGAPSAAAEGRAGAACTPALQRTWRSMLCASGTAS